ncbi:MAG TPA: BREX-2 system adenine-specific DNA-methyltransferase PglX, partial [Actinomycetales bacterium]|nr:BREX-2 system adenine-specific DNA-methyltransferase PglX [Actinomycetales bacterium]
VAIARFRLLIAAMKLSGYSQLEQTPAFPVRVATGDSLLPWGAGIAVEQTDVLTWQSDKPFAYASEDDDLLTDYLRPGQYTVVVGNPPYITVADPARNKRYRELYPSVCHRQYALTVPFAKRFFDLAKRGDHQGDGAGLVGQITGNAFMKREFGKKLINDFFNGQIELTEVIDTSGAYIPGHGTPTVILVGRNRYPSSRYSAPIRTVLGIRGEPSTPDNPADGKVWTAIVTQIDKPGSESEWVSVADFDRAQLATHPWSLSGGGSAELMESLADGQRSLLGEHLDVIGRTTHTGLDDAFYSTEAALRTRDLVRAAVPVVLGEDVRDFGLTAAIWTMFPYDEGGEPRDLLDNEQRFYWPNRTALRLRLDFGQSPEQRGLRWFDHSMFFAKRFQSRLSIAFAFVATHNHFVLDRGGKVFNRSAPVVKLPEGATEDDHLRLLGVLNSSTACFWLKQVSQDKGNRGGERSTARYAWERFFEFTGTKLQEFLLPSTYPLERARELDRLAQHLAGLTPAAMAGSGVPTRQRLAEARAEYESVRARMIAAQEELDWEVYRLYGLIDEDLTCPEPPELKLGERAFEIVLAASGAQTEWFNRHGSTPITEPPAHWPADYRDLVARRIAAIETNRHIGLVERPECKRRWATDGWDKLQTAALRDWLLDRLEAPELWDTPATPLSVAQLSDRVRHDEDFRTVLELWIGHDAYDLTKTLTKLLADEHVPYLPAQRYKPAGLRKRALWERTWELQRQEDAGEQVGAIEVPPKYTSADFTRPTYWRNRGKLDVPKERFISYPAAGRDGDDTELLGWAGWDHLTQAQALAAIYLDRKTQAAWPTDRLLPLLAGLAELEPWLHQWHNGEHPAFPGPPAQFFTDFINTELAQLDADRPTLARLRGVPGDG